MFKSTTESEITKAIVSNFSEDMKKFVKTDVIVIGGGPSGLIAAKEIAKQNIDVLIIERNNYLGGGFWAGGFLMNKITIRKPADEILRELEIPYTETEDGMCLTSSPHACAK